MLELNRNTAASLLMDGHIFCAGSLAQCLKRWSRLSNAEKAAAFLKMGRDGVSPTIVRGEELEALAGKPELLYL